jgi:hypothetical protein
LCENILMEKETQKCYQFFHCDKEHCQARTDERQCWEVEGVECRNKALKKIAHELEILDENKCDYCLYHSQQETT